MAWIERRGKCPECGLQVRSGGNCKQDGSPVTRTVEWRVCWREADGSRQSESYHRGEDAANRKKELERSLDDGSYVDPALGRQTTFKQYWSGYLEGAAVRPSTLDLYQRLGRLYLIPFFGSKPLASITRQDVRKFLASAKEKNRAASVNASFRLFRRVMNTAIEDGMIARSPTTGIKAPSPGTEEMRFLDANQVRALADAIDGRYRTLIFLLAYTGIRMGEACALRRGDLDVKTGRLQIVRSVSEVAGVMHEGPTKTGAKRTVTLPPFLLEMMKNDLPARGLMFTSPDGAQLRPNNWRKRFFDKAVTKAGVGPLHPHELRHTQVALLVAAGAPVKAIADRLGHSSPTVTLQRYSHVLPALEAQLAEGLETAFLASAPSVPPKRKRGARRRA